MSTTNTVGRVIENYASAFTSMSFGIFPGPNVKAGQVVSVARSRFKHVVTYVDPIGHCVWCKPIGARDTREKRIFRYDIQEVDKFMTEVYKTKGAKK